MVDYSKWKDIEISDDEDDIHPNIDTPSLFRWRHQARVERMAEREKEKIELTKKKTEHDKKINELKDKMEKVEVKDDIKKSLEKLEKERDQLKKKENQLEHQEKNIPWNVDTISKEGFSKTVINTTGKRVEEHLTEDEKMEQFKQFIKDNESLIKQFGFFRHYNDSLRFLMEHYHLVCEHTANYLLIHCVNLEVEEKNELMKSVAHQSICVNFILELAKQLDRDPRSCVAPFFHRIQKAEPEYKKAFTDELDALISRVEQRAATKIEEAIQEVKEEEKKERAGPGGLDPMEVLETLPEELKSCFEVQDIAKLQEVINNMDPTDAVYHMKRCVDSGLWVPQGYDDPHAQKKSE